MLTRRTFCLLAVSTGAMPSLSRLVRAGDVSGALEAELANIEKTSGGRLGVAVFDTKTGTGRGYRSNELFPMCSTFKLWRRQPSSNASIRARKGSIAEFSSVCPISWSIHRQRRHASAKAV